MIGQFADIAVWAGMLALVGAAIALSWPYRRERRFVMSRVLSAPREMVWDIYHPGSEHPAYAAFHANVVSCEKVGTGPAVWEQVIDSSGGHGTHLTTLKCELLIEQRPQRSAIRARERDGQLYPFGATHRETLDLQEHAGGTLVTLGFHGETASLWQYLHLWLVFRAYLRRLQKFCESGAAASGVSKGRPLWASLALSAIAIFSFSLFFGWIGGLFIAGVLVVHEFGHWLAMRLTGQPAPRNLLVPFFGGLAVANHPHKTLFDDAFCSLMGAGFSALPVLVLMLAAWAMGVPDMTHLLQAATEDGATYEASKALAELLAIAAVAIAALLGALNLLQLAPVLPLDGGQVLRALFQSFSPKWARRVLLGVTGLGIVFLGYSGDYILAGILGLGALEAWQLGSEAPAARPMGRAGVVVISSGYCVVLAIHAGAVLYSLRLFAIV